jgi:NTE family protein
MPKTALVLSGGGAKGAFQVGAVKYAHEQRGYQWDVIAGVSVGALNGTMLAMRREERLEEIWSSLTRSQIYTGSLNLWAGLRLWLGARSIYSHEPLWRLIDREIDPRQVQIDLRIGTVSLRTGEYVLFRPTDRGFKKAVLASTAIPLIWPPVDVSAGRKDMVDGGMRNVSPLGDVLDTEPDQVIIVNCDPRRPPVTNRPLANALEIGRVALEVAVHETLVSDLREFLRINHMVRDAASYGVTLYKEDGTPFKYYDYTIIEPDDSLGDILDFSRESLDRRMQAGWDKAARVLG